MKLEILDLKIKPNNRRLAYVRVKYYDLVVNCEVVFYKNEDKVWIRMPEYWFVWEKKTRYCYWPEKDISDKFQKEVLEKIEEKYSKSIADFKELYLRKKRISKCVDKNIKE